MYHIPSSSNPQTILDDSLENYFNMNMCIITSGLFYIKKNKVGVYFYCYWLDACLKKRNTSCNCLNFKNGKKRGIWAKYWNNKPQL